MQRLLVLPILGPTAAFLSLWPATASPQEAESGPVHWGYSAYFGTGWYSVSGDNLEFTAGSQQITDQWELGAALGEWDSPIHTWFMKFKRLGLGYRTSSSGDLRGIKFVFRSMFDE